MRISTRSQPVISFFRTFLFSFKAHPASVNESYFQHLRFAFRLSGRLLVAGGAAMVHALIPALFETTASRQVAEIHRLMTNRHRNDQ